MDLNMMYAPDLTDQFTSEDALGAAYALIYKSPRIIR